MATGGSGMADIITLGKTATGYTIIGQDPSAPSGQSVAMSCWNNATNSGGTGGSCQSAYIQETPDSCHDRRHSPLAV